MITRRTVLCGFIAAPAVVRFASLMPVRGIIMPIEPKLEEAFAQLKKIHLIVGLKQDGTWEKLDHLWLPTETEMIDLVAWDKQQC